VLRPGLDKQLRSFFYASCCCAKVCDAVENRGVSKRFRYDFDYIWNDLAYFEFELSREHQLKGSLSKVDLLTLN
jgi:hypothetical protein